MLYPDMPKPLYQQLKEAIRQGIRNGTYLSEQALPGERQLMETYGVSRMTVRQAIGDLVSEGILLRRHGSGTFVAPKASEKPLIKLYGLVEELQLYGYDTTIELIDSRTVSPGREVVRELRLKENEPAFCYKRLISADEKPLLFTTSYITQHMSQLFENMSINLSKDVVYEHLELCGYTIKNAVQRIRADKPDADEAEHLHCEAQEPVLVIERTTFLHGDHPVIYTRAVYRKEYSFSAELKRSFTE